MANTTDYTRLLDGYSLLAIKDFVAANYAAKTHTHDDRYLKLSGGAMTGNISYQGTKATYTMIKFLDNTGDTYGNGISIGGGGAVVVGAGESADAIISGAGVSGGTETLYLGSDNNIYILTNVQNGYASAKTFTFDASGNLTVPGSITEAGTTLANKYAAKSHTHTKSQITDFPSSMPASDVYAWAKAATKPSYSFSEITSRGESLLGWGGQGVAGSVTPIGLALSNEHSANKLAFINGACLTFEYSSDAGSTWTDYGYSASTKSQFCTQSYSVPIGRTSGEYTTNSRTRITLTAQNGTTGYVYTDPVKLLINISSSGGMNVLIEYRSGTNFLNDGAWTTFGTYSLSGWSGWNDIPLVLGTLGGGTTQKSNNWQLRLTFIMTSKNTQYPTTAHVQAIRLYGRNSWTVPSTMASTGHLYSFDMSQNATFPARISATSFTENGTSLVDKYAAKSHTHSYAGSSSAGGAATSANKLNTNAGSATNPVYFSGGVPVACTYSLNKTVPADAVFTDTTYSAEKGISLSGTKFGHSNTAITAQTTQALYPIKIDAYGHITGYGTAVTSLPASDVYAWAKAATKPSYNFGEISAGVATIGDGANRLMFRTNGTWESGMYYHTTGAEAMVFMNKGKTVSGSTGYSTSWIFAYGNVSERPTWTGLTPAVQIKESSLIINKLVDGSHSPSYNLDVNGTANATTIYQNGTTLDNTYLGKTAKAADSDLLDGHDSSYFINTSNIGSQYVYHSDTSDWATDASNSSKLNNQAASYYLNYNNLTNKPSAVLYTSQTLTDAQKTQARTNIGAGTSSFTGYTSSNKLHTDYINNAAGWTSVTESTVSGWGFTKNAGTVTSVKVGSTSYSPSSGVVSLPAYPTKSSWNYDDTYIKLSGSSSITGNLVPNTNGASAEGYNLGSSSKKWKYGYFYYLYSGGIEINNGSNTYTIWSDGAIARGNVGASPNVVLTLPNTEGTLALVGDNNHSHTLSIASGGSSPTTLAANTTYTLTAGGSTLVFKTPPSSSAYYSNQFNQAYFFSTNVAVALSNLTDAGNMQIGFSNYPTTHDYYLQSGHNINTYSKYFIMNLAQASDYVGSIIFGRTDNGYDNIIVSRGDYGPTTGYTQENLDILRIYASSLYINVKSSDTVLYSIPLGRKCHTITITSGTGTSTILFNLRNTNYGQITSIANVCAALYHNGHRNAASALIATGIYGSYTKPIIGIYATSSNSGLNVVYMNSTTKSTASITSGTVADNTSTALYEP